MRLKRALGDKPILENLEVADTLWSRTKGLLGRASLNPDQGLWILRCNSIHTFFMKFPIDVVFLNKNLVVTKTLKAVQPGKVVFPVWRATSVIEFKSGFLDEHPLTVGEKLHVDSALS